MVVPPLLVPRRYGGHRVLARWLRRALGDVDVLWVNDPVAGVAAWRPDVPTVYDVTDDWRAAPQSAADRARVVAAEDLLARRAHTVVCSAVLAERWLSRYGVTADVISNGVDLAALREAQPRRLDGPAPHAVYVGTVHANRVDVDLVADLAVGLPGTVHLVGPDGLEPAVRERLQDLGVRLHGRLPAAQIPPWLVSADVLICPHLVDDFTLSLDAIKSHEYLATTAPVVATPSSGFQSLTAPGLTVVGRPEFVDGVTEAVGTGPFERKVAVDWNDRAADFTAALQRAKLRT